MKTRSLRTRLIIIILTPLLLIAVGLAVLEFRGTTERAGEIFDRGLLSAALAISRDVALSGGDALSPDTRRLISDTSGGELFYHVFAPDGVFVTGYATPPRPPSAVPMTEAEPLFYDAIYQGRDVRALRFQDAATLDGFTGIFTISVWQDMGVRASFVTTVVSRTIAVLLLLVLSVALIVWFGVRLGLRPLLELEDAIARRTPSDLTPIRRPVPTEAQGIVATLNALLDRVARRISSKDEFISNAAHQLRNPIAGVLALAEAVESAPTRAASKARSAELVAAAREATHLTNQLLSFERAKGSDTAQPRAVLDLAALCQTVISRFEGGSSLCVDHVQVILDAPTGPVCVSGDDLMVQEALLNLLTNAVLHGGRDVSRIVLRLTADGDVARLEVRDNGIGIAPEDRTLAVGRFSQPKAGPGTGLGLPIAARVMENHGGRLTIAECDQGACIVLELPLAELA
ncbi:sensor histidine kinase [Tateyamaria omphalii]|uniref:sensor histidine kinase n=1 Tax=Tateyamaria omphalii TaxID=299262 RepID=UPI001C994E79|nr:sensor histidine kinase [Tateyamaria omphalii]MBY5935162.1 sensor histidine kinase [Tateyamaria omphalii]